jgi:hypothetical protein
MSEYLEVLNRRIAVQSFQPASNISILNILFSDPTRGNANAMLFDFKMGTVAYE